MTTSTQPSENTQYRTPRRSGQIMVLFAFFFIFILGLFVVNYNIGDLVRQKIQLQNAADAASIAAARSLGLGMGYLTIINDMVLADLTVGLTTIIAELAIPIIGWALVIPTALGLLEKLDWDFILGDAYLVAGPYLAQEAGAVMGYVNGAEFAWTILDDSMTGVNTGSNARLQLNVPAPDNWSSLYSNIFFHLIFPRTDTSFPERAVVVAWNKKDQSLLFGQEYMEATTKNMYAVSSSTIYYVPQALSDLYQKHMDQWLPGSDYDGRMTNLTPEWYIWCPWIGGAYWWPRLVPNADFNATTIGLPLYTDFDSAYSKMMNSNVGFGLDSSDVVNLIYSFSDTFSFLGDIFNAINNIGDDAF